MKASKRKARSKAKKLSRHKTKNSISKSAHGIDPALNHLMKLTLARDECIICNNPGVVSTSFFIPNETSVHRFGGIPGRQRIVAYGLCVICNKLPNKTQLVEEVITARVNSRINDAQDKLDTMNCVCCGGVADMVHVMNGKGQCVGTCQMCRDTRNDICSVVQVYGVCHCAEQ